jgi:hypothetical protein
VADEHDSKRLFLIKAKLDHAFVTLFEDVQLQRHAWEEHGIQWK